MDKLDQICTVFFRTFDCTNCDVAAISQCVLSLFPEIGLTLDVIERRIHTLLTYKTILARLLEQPLIAQRTPEWYALRKQRLTASDTAQALNVGKFGSRNQLVSKKVAELQGIERPFRTLPAMQWGIMFEAMALRCYQQRNMDIVVHEFGLIPHPTLSCYGASPDGISDIGIMIEIKCPFKRKIVPGDVPDYYELQMQGQMAVCGLKECDYIECDMQVFDTLQDYIACLESTNRVDHGAIIETRDGDKYAYKYSPAYLTSKEVHKWVCENISDGGVCKYWRLRQICIQRVMFDENRWQQIVPKLEEFWADVIENSKKEIETPKANKKSKYEFIAESDSD